MTRRVRGLALRYGSMSEDMGFKEHIRAGALRGAKLDQCVAQRNHNPDLVMATVEAGTLELRKTKTGLRYSFEAPRSPSGDDLLASVRRGDTSKSSFSFTVAKDAEGRYQDHWYRDKKTGEVVREIIKFERIYDVSPVTAPAYRSTTCELG